MNIKLIRESELLDKNNGGQHNPNEKKNQVSQDRVPRNYLAAVSNPSKIQQQAKKAEVESKYYHQIKKLLM